MPADPSYPWTPIVALLAAVLILPVLPGTVVAAAPAVHSYDFETGTQGWQLATGIWSRLPEGSGHALRGVGHGNVTLTARSGHVSAFLFRLRLDGMGSRVHANLMESLVGGKHQRYLVGFSAAGVKISQQSGATFEELGQGFTPIAPSVFHQIEIRFGGGSIDVFVNGEDSVGVDDSTPPPDGGVSFESLDGSVVWIDDVEVAFGPETAAHARAERPLLALPNGPDNAWFVGGRRSGSIDLTGSEILVLKQGRYTLEQGHITLYDNSRLRIEKGAVLVFDRAGSPLMHWGIRLRDNGALEIVGGDLLAVNGALVPVQAFGNSTVQVRQSRPWIHFINAGGQAVVTVQDSRFVTDLGGSLQVGGKATVIARDSRIGAVAMTVPAGSRFHAANLHPGRIAAFDLQNDLKPWKVDYELRLLNVEMEPDTLGPGPFERGWILFVDETAMTRVQRSRLRKLIYQLPAGGPPLAISDLRLGRPTTLQVGDVEIADVVVTGQWGFFIKGPREAVFDRCEGLWFFLWNDADVLLRDSQMNEFDPRAYHGRMRFEESHWVMGGEIIPDSTTAPANDFLMAGTLQIEPKLKKGLSWAQSAVTRSYPVRIVGPGGEPKIGVSVVVREGKREAKAVTDRDGWADFALRFTDSDYKIPWTLHVGGGEPLTQVDFFTETPLLLEVP